MRINSLYYKQNINIAFPIMLSLAGQAIVQMADNIMVGQLGAPELAAVSLAGAIIMNTMVVGMGIATGLTPLVGQAHALDDKERIAGFFQKAFCAFRSEPQHRVPCSAVRRNYQQHHRSPTHREKLRALNLRAAVGFKANYRRKTCKVG